jgi:glycine hydroxymethyltransferase
MFTIDTEGVCSLIRRKKPRLVILGASLILFPYDLESIRKCCDDVGSYLGYDGSHVLGLIAGKRFQPDSLEFCDVLIGSTHKTFFGPQGGIILSRSDDIKELFS